MLIAPHRARFDTQATPLTLFGIDIDDPVRGDDRIADVKVANRLHHAAAAAAAVADVGDVALHVVAGLGQPGFFGSSRGCPWPLRW